MSSSTWSPATTATMPTIPMTGWWRPLGRTGLTVSALCLGGGPRRPRRPHTSEVGGDTNNLVDQARIHHIRFVDTTSNGAARRPQPTAGTTAEPGGPHGSVIVATTVATDTDDPSGPQIRAAVAARAQQLNMPRLPLVYLHLRPRQPVDAITAPGGPLDTLVTLRAAGEIAALGVAGSDIGQLSRSLDLGVFDALRVHGRWTLLDRSADALLDHAAAAGIAVVNADVYAGGLLRGTRGGGSLSKRAVRPVVAEAADAMDLVCRWWGTDLATAALLFSVRDRRVTSTVTRLTAPAALTSTFNVLAADLVEPFWDELETLLPPPDYERPTPPPPTVGDQRVTH